MPTLNWIGKEAVVNHDKEVPFRLLRKVKSASVGDNSQNLIIHGDNLEALKALMPYYGGKVKCIYIDPPYNTGNENWVYNDKVNSPKIKKWLGKVVGNQTADLCRHDKWLCMMYPRLKLLKDLMSEDGVIFLSVDDNEVENLKALLNEIFGKDAFVGQAVWYKKRKGSFLSKEFISLTEYILIYRKDKKLSLFGGRPDSNESQPLVKRTNNRSLLVFPANVITTKLPDGIYSKGVYGKGSSAIELSEDVIVKKTVIVTQVKLIGPFVWSQNFLDEELLEGTKLVINTKNFQPRAFRDSSEKFKGFPSYIDGREFSATNDDAYEDLIEIFGREGTFNYSKPRNLIRFLINSKTFIDKDAIILDSFAGSGTTGHAVLDLNKEDGGNRKFILIEMEDKVAKDITAERIKRAIKKYDYDDGFEYCELSKPLFNEKGHIEEECDFDQFATYIYFTETQTNIDRAKVDKNFIGELNETEYYLIYKEKGKNILDKGFLKKLRDTKAKKVIYADNCTVDEKILDEYNIVFKQIPYEVKVY